MSNNAAATLSNYLSELEHRKPHRVLGAALNSLFKDTHPLPKQLLSLALEFGLSPYIQHKITESPKTFKGRIGAKLGELAKLTTEDLCQKLLEKQKKSSKLVDLAAYHGIGGKVDKVMDKRCPVNCLVMLMYGPPGTGKSHISTFLAARNQSSVHRLKLREADGSLRSVEDLLEDLRDSFEGTVFLLDEIDTITDPKEQARMNELLDDIKQLSNKLILVMTTNYIDKVKDLPMCRPGRVDIIREVSYLTPEDVKALCDMWDMSVEEVIGKITGPITVAKVTQACRDIVLTQLIEGATPC
jgi:SpoVK/Ycf46/Vps4 family AAA+-type ATPase